jgi:hypothetical protein
MKQGAISKFQSAVRWFLLISVIAAGFFSSGEGVQLLPFPDTRCRSERCPFDFNGTPDKSYAFSVHNLSITAAAKIGSQKKAKKDTTVERSTPTDLTYVFDPGPTGKPHGFLRSTSVISAPDLLLPSGRAPPSMPTAVS